MKKGIHIVNLKRPKIGHSATVYYIFNMSSCRMSEIRNDFPKDQVKLLLFNKQWSKMLNYVYFDMF